jgi:tripartite motif-containing protein 71
MLHLLLSLDFETESDFYNNNIQKFDSNGKYLTKWGSKGSGNGQFFRPCDVAFDSSGNIYIAEFLNHRIQKFDSSGKYLTKWVFNDNPWSVAVSPSGYVYVSKVYSNCTQKFDSNGNLLTQWGSYGSGDGQFYIPRGIAVDSSGDVYVADRHNHRIQKFDSNGNFITKWGSFGSDDGQLNYTWDVAVDSSGNVYVADWDNRRIDKFAPTGQVHPITNFTSNATSGYAPLSVQFIDKSTGSPTKWNWDFGDGAISTSKNPTHKYSVAGIYTVILTATNAAGNNTVKKSSYITVKSLPKKPVANFSASPTTGKAPLTVKFTDKSRGSPTSWSWNFGDGSTSKAKNTTHKYIKKGKYTVSLTVKNAAGNNAKTMSRYITVK